MWQLLLSKQLFGGAILKCIIVFLIALCEFQWRICSQQFLHNVSCECEYRRMCVSVWVFEVHLRKGFRNEKKQNTFWRIWLLSKPHYSHVSGQYFTIISSLRKKMLSYISSVHLWPAYQSMRDFWVRGFWKNLRLGINPEHSCIKTKMFSSTCIVALKALHVCIFIMTCWLLHLQAVFFKKKGTLLHINV